jgi:predicted DNA-binding transcriptional regulator YafY
MKQSDRQLLILNRLRAERPLRAIDFAEECDCSVRTIYRDIEALSAAGIPVAALPGEGYRLVPGFHLPPIAFTAEEAAQLMRGAELVTGLGTRDHEEARRTATAKLEAALPESTLSEVSRLRDRMRAEPWPRRPPSQWLGVLLQATLQERVVRLRYHSFGGDEVTERNVEPHHLSYYADDWHLRGHCRLRDGGRDFRLGRIQQVVLTDEPFARRPELTDTPREDVEGQRVVEFRVWLADSVLPWAREDLPYGFVREEPAEDGAVFLIESDQERRIVPWILRWGASARALSPSVVVERLRDEAVRMARSYRNG